MTNRKRVLILCTGNSARSQMAEGLLRHLAGERGEVASAGVSPTQVRPEAVAVMREIGIDISNHRSKSVDEFTDQKFDYVITVCDNANEQCPIFSGNTQRIHWSFDDPAARGHLGDVEIWRVCARAAEPLLPDTAQVGSYMLGSGPSDPTSR